MRAYAYTLLALAAVVRADEVVLAAPGADGVLAHYAFASPRDSAAFVTRAEAAGLDVWLATPERADVFMRAPHTPPAGASSMSLVSFPAPIPSTLQDDEELPALAHLNSSFHSAYHPLGALGVFARALEEMAPDLVSRRTYGYSAEGRPLEVLHVRDGANGANASVLVSGSPHAREWVAPAAAAYLLHALVVPANESGSLRSLLEHHDFYVVLTPNPDGYAYSWSTDRLWTKNRQPPSATRKCVGIDLARNWGYKWKRSAPGPRLADEYEDEDEDGNEDAYTAATDPCAPAHPGFRPFEAPETSALDVLLRSLPSPAAFVELRAYGQLVSAPFAHSCGKTPKDAEDLLELGAGMAHVAHGAVYGAGRACAQLRRAGGDVLDWVYREVGVRYAYTVRLRDTGTYGFALPAALIRPVGEEAAEMVAYVAKFMRAKAPRKN